MSKGFSLVEVIIALGLVMVTMMIFAVTLAALPLVKSSRNQNIAYHIASKKLEEMRKTSFVSLPSSGAFTDPGLAKLSSGTAALTVSNYQGNDQIKQILVTVGWIEQSKSASLNVETLISKNGLNPP